MLASTSTTIMKIDTDSHYSDKLSETIKTDLKQEFLEFDRDYSAHCENLDSWMFVNPTKFPNSDDRVKIRKHKFAVYKICRVFETILDENQDCVDKFLKIQERGWRCVERMHSVKALEYPIIDRNKFF